MGSEMCIRDSPSSFLCLYHLSMPQFAWIRWHEAMQSMNGGHKKAAKPSPHTACLLYTSPSPQTSQDLVCRLLLEKKKIHYSQNTERYYLQKTKKQQP